MSALRHVYDVSNWQGDLVDDMILAYENHIDEIIIRISLEPWLYQITQKQLAQVKAGGFKIGGYVWAYWEEDPVICILEVVERFDIAGVPLPKILWVDCEQGGAYTSEIISWLTRAQAQALKWGITLGIYTSKYWWQHYTQDTGVFNSWPLWRASYDDDSTLGNPGFGGWVRDVGHQYTDTPIDTSVFKGEPEMGDELASNLTTALAYVCDDLGNQITDHANKLYSMAEELVKIQVEMKRVRDQFLGPKQ